MWEGIVTMQNPVSDERYSVADEAILGAFFKLVKKKTTDQIDLTVKLTGNLNQLRNWARFKSCRQVNSDWFFNHNKSSSFIRSSSAISLNFLSR